MFHICKSFINKLIFVQCYLFITAKSSWYKTFQFLYSYPRRLVKKCKPGDAEDYAVDEEFNLPICVAIAITMVYMFGGAVMYQVSIIFSYLQYFLSSIELYEPLLVIWYWMIKFAVRTIQYHVH